ncbi:hypothetical protein C5688_08040 [Methylocystis sp. MitZ-2018]|nr:hypothetical protein C5688_08040 [Methylocystis sp. MitZ-2018]
MRFPYPLLPAEFEIPDEWWTEAGMTAFTLAGVTYRSSGGAQPIALREIEPPFRSVGCPKDFGGFDRERLVAVLRGIAGGDEIPPVQLRALKPLNDWHRLPFPIRSTTVFIVSMRRSRQVLNFCQRVSYESALPISANVPALVRSVGDQAHRDFGNCSSAQPKQFLGDDDGK